MCEKQFLIRVLLSLIHVLLSQVQEHVINYTHCNRTVNGTVTGTTCATYLQENPNSLERCQCRLQFNLKTDFKKNVFMYYGLTNYYQNHRRYVKSRDDNQLLGEFGGEPTDCSPFDRDVNGRTIVPCGAIANSLFNDTLTLESVSFGKVESNNTGIAWPSDKQIKFRNPPNWRDGKLCVSVIVTDCCV